MVTVFILLDRVGVDPGCIAVGADVAVQNRAGNTALKKNRIKLQ